MTVFDSPEFDNHAAIHFVSDAPSGLKAIIAVHDGTLGPALGGLRVFDYDQPEDALTDVLRLSRGMTYKNALAGIPFGGGKAVILGDPKTVKTPALLTALGRAIHHLSGTYITAEDVGTTVADMDALRAETPFARGVTGGAGDPSPYTARGVLHAIKCALAARFGSADPARKHVAIQGLGNVGRHLAQMLHDDGARLTVTDIDPNRLAAAQSDWNAAVVAPAEIYDVYADVFAPCAMGAVLDDKTIPMLRTAIVCGAANNQLALDRHGPALAERGILYVPDFIANAGGVINIGLEGTADQAEILRHVDGIAETVTSILDRAGDSRLPVTVAEELALEKLASVKDGWLAA